MLPLAATLDIILSLNAWRNMRFSQILRYILKFAMAAAWAVVLPVGYFSLNQNPTGVLRFFNSLGRDWRGTSFYYYAVTIYMIPNFLAAMLFCVPYIRRTMERSSLLPITLLMWWAQVDLHWSRLTFFQFQIPNCFTIDICFKCEDSQNFMWDEGCMRICFHL